MLDCSECWCKPRTAIDGSLRVSTVQGRLQQEYADIQRRAQELMSTMDIPGEPLSRGVSAHCSRHPRQLARRMANMQPGAISR